MPSLAQTVSEPPPDMPQTVVITGSVRERAQIDAPYAIGSVDNTALRSAGPMVNLSEAMVRVPGLVVANRNNYAQDLQISSRGFGARAGFGVRGVRLYTDGIPASMPDGQGQVSHFDLADAQRVEVLRGPFSVLYGNSSGGVVAAVSQPVRVARLELAADRGGAGLEQYRLSLSAPLGGGLEGRVGLSTLDWEGFRPNSQASKTAMTARLAWQGRNDRVQLLINQLDQPALDPLGLTQAQLDQDPNQTTPQATQFNTRKEAQQQQLGLRWAHRFNVDSGMLETAVTAYQGDRSVRQWLAIAAGTQANARHGGGLLDFARTYKGLDLRLTRRSGAVAWVLGAATERQSDDRQGYNNYTGAVATPVYGGVGTLRRDEVNNAVSNDVYGQLEWDLSQDWMLSAGVRSGRVQLSSQDRFLSNGDDSGRRSFSYSTPVLGLRWQPNPQLTWHMSVARGFESPTLGELAYRADNTGGFNTALLPQRSRQAELGVKWRADAAGTVGLDAAVFQVRVDDEIGVATNAGGRQAFQNVGRTQRQGLELAAHWRPHPRQWPLRAQVAVTLLDATYDSGFLACAGIPCTAPSVPVAAGNRIAGTQRGLAFAELAWLPHASWEVALELRAASALTANDTNTAAAKPYQLLALRAMHQMPLGGGARLELLARLDNALNRNHASSVIVNEANARFFEPGAPRQVLLSVRVLQDF